MSGDTAATLLEARLLDIREKYGETIPVDSLAEILGEEALLADVQQDLLAEFSDLARHISDAKQDIAALNPDEVTSTFIPTATDELDAIVEATAAATNSIMDIADVIEGVAGNLEGDNANQLLDATTKIYEACTFQDITGQRVTKVITALRHIENKISAILAIFGSPMPTEDDGGAAKEVAATDEDLLNGPQLPKAANRQDEIDALFDD